ncbi:hypothetical protein [Longispora fulva]|uniref:hypothetical protein n=1 Tax=Longispora fulva TaxID=619741 RepID=UPI0018CA72FF|nr:hypothetical protein [Longispora fulva]
MDIEIAQTANAAMPYVTAVVAAYGKETVAKIRDVVTDRLSDATIDIGRRVLDRVLNRDELREVIEGALVDVAAGEEDAEVALRLQIRKALAADPGLAVDVAGILASAGSHVQAQGARSVAVGTNSGVILTGDQAVHVEAQHNHGTGMFIAGNVYNTTGSSSGEGE